MSVCLWLKQRSQNSYVSTLLLACSLATGAACGSEDDGESATGAETQAESVSEAAGATSGESGESSATSDGSATNESGETSESGESSEAGSTDTGGMACFSDGGIYGNCSDNPTCQCLQGASVYQACTQNCTGAGDCGDAADFPGAVPGCFPLNPGSSDMICALLCDTTDDCPCGLECQPSGVPNTNICAEFQ